MYRPIFPHRRLRAVCTLVGFCIAVLCVSVSPLLAQDATAGELIVAEETDIDDTAATEAEPMTPESLDSDQTDDTGDSDLSDISLSLESLMTLQVTSVAGVGQDWSKSPAALSVLTNDMIQRSGHLTLPEVLRMAPGVFVGRFNTQAYAISPRGFNSLGANKSLVLVDGRIAYDPLFSGVLWDSVDTMLEDVEQIEIIRGPGPTLWGANAVNGVINVSTKSAKFTQGLYASGTYGNEVGLAEVRYGDRLSDNAWFRVWGKYFANEEMTQENGGSAHDDWSIGRGGFRVDGEGEEFVSWTVDAGVYNSFTKGEDIQGLQLPGAHLTSVRSIDDGRISGGHLSFRLAKETPDSEGWSFHTYYEQAERVTNVNFETERHTFFGDWRHHFDANEQHKIMWGLSAWVNVDDMDNSFPSTTYVTEENRTMSIFGGFLQDTITLAPDELFMMIGSKFDWNDRTGFEVQPGVRLWWTPDDMQTLWGSVTRAVRLPSRLEEDGYFPIAYVDTGLFGGGPPSGVIIPLAFSGSRDLDAEELIAYELGYRISFNKSVALGTSLFYNDYDDLVTLPVGGIGEFNNKSSGESYGGELTLDWQVAPNWRLAASYSFVRVMIHDDPFPISHEGQTPQHQATLRSFLDITKDLQFNTLVYYTDTIPTVDADANVRVDMGLVWQATENVELSLWGQNIFDKAHREYVGDNENERVVYFQVTARF